MKKRRRYPGTQPFTKEYEGQFFGREIETNHLAQLISVESFVLLFARSGTGKSSLINVGLIPKLKENKYDVIEVSFQNKKYINQGLSPIDIILKQLNVQAQSLWTGIKEYCERSSNTPVLIFDQFEEFFYHYKEAEEKKHFFKEIHHVINGSPPDYIEAIYKEGYWEAKKEESKEKKTALLDEIETLVDSPKCKVIFSIRSVDLSLLEKYSDIIPRIFMTRFELLPLSISQAQEAILQPANLQDTNYESPILDFQTEHTLQLILKTLSESHVNELSIEEGQVDPFSLQLICSHIENEVIAKREEQHSANEVEIIDKSYLDNFQTIQKDFYSNIILALPGSNHDRLVIRKFIESSLIVDGTRPLRNISEVAKSLNIEGTNTWNRESEIDKVLHPFLANRIIRKEIWNNRNHYILSHDSWIPPISESGKLRESEEQAIKGKKLKRGRHS